jgi:DNA polymerase-3 subunit epsilon
MFEPLQATLEAGVPLSEVTFFVVDIETTGGSPRQSGITEIGAVRYQGGERVGVFHSLVDPREPIPPHITQLTGIDDLMVAGAPPIEQVLPSLVEFARGGVFVAHNARFDHSFLNVQTQRLGYDPFPSPPICTARFARRVVWPEVPNVRLKTLSGYFRTRTRPTHRALEDAQSCAEVLQGLIDLAGRLGIVTLGDLQEAVRARGRPNFGKIRLADHLPSCPGVYIFRSRSGDVLYVGKSKDLRARVKSYFYGDPRKKVDNLLAEVSTVEGLRCDGELEALVVEARSIGRHEPRYNRRGKAWRRYAYLKLDPSEAFPRMKVVHRARTGDGCTYVGPFASSARAHLAKEGLEEIFPLRRCTRAMGARTRSSPCALADIGRCPAPCDGAITPERYGELVRSLLSSLSTPDGLLVALESRMRALAAKERYEEAARVRDRLGSLASALWRARQDAWLRDCGTVILRDPAGSQLTFREGCMVIAGDDLSAELPLPRDRADEASAVRSWLARNPVRLVSCDRGLAEPVDGGRSLSRILTLLRVSEDGSNVRDHDRRSSIRR